MSRIRSASSAKARLLGDQVIRPVAEQRAQLAILSERLDRAGRGAMTEHLAERVRTDRRFAPVLGRLMQLALRG